MLICERDFTISIIFVHFIVVVTHFFSVPIPIAGGVLRGCKKLRSYSIIDLELYNIWKNRLYEKVSDVIES